MELQYLFCIRDRRYLVNVILVSARVMLKPKFHYTKKPAQNQVSDQFQVCRKQVCNKKVDVKIHVDLAGLWHT